MEVVYTFKKQKGRKKQNKKKKIYNLIVCVGIARDHGSMVHLKFVVYFKLSWMGKI